MDTLAIFCIAAGSASALCLLALVFFSATSKKNATGRRVSLIFLGIFAIAAVTGCFFLADRDPTLPTLAEMRASFAKERPHLESLVRMSDQDNAFTGIAADYITSLPTAASPRALFRYGDPTAPLPQSRWDEYRTLLLPYGPLATLERSAFGDVTIYTWNGPWRGVYRATGYTHCTTTPQVPTGGATFRRKPCGDAVLLESAGPADPTTGPHPHFSNVQDLSDGWYAFEIGID